MSATLTFDTLKFVTRLESAGVPRQHAQAEAEALAEVLQSGSAELATKRDIEMAVTSLKAELKAEISSVKSELIKWVVGLALAQSALLVGVLMRLPH